MECSIPQPVSFLSQFHSVPFHSSLSTLPDDFVGYRSAGTLMVSHGHDGGLICHLCIHLVTDIKFMPFYCTTVNTEELHYQEGEEGKTVNMLLDYKETAKGQMIGSHRTFHSTYYQSHFAYQTTSTFNAHHSCY